MNTVTIKTAELNEMVSKVAKCVSNNKLIPLTSLISIKVEGNVFTLSTTDATNYMYVSANDKVPCEDFEVCVLADLFVKLVQKTTSETTTLVVNNGILEVQGNGSYKMELPLDENGAVIKFPKKFVMSERQFSDNIKLSTVKNIIAVNKSALAVNMEMPVLVNYYCGESVITSDRKMVCRNKVNLFVNPQLIAPAVMELVGSFSNEDISVSVSDDSVVFHSNTDCVYAPIVPGVSNFPAGAINNLADADFESSCKLPKNVILNVIERVGLFVSKYDNHGINLTFTNDGVMFSSIKKSGSELVGYVESNNFKPYSCRVNIDMLKSQVASVETPEIELYYGSETAIKIESNNVTKIVALITDEEG